MTGTGVDLLLCLSSSYRCHLMKRSPFPRLRLCERSFISSSLSAVSSSQHNVFSTHHCYKTSSFCLPAHARLNHTLLHAEQIGKLLQTNTATHPLATESHVYSQEAIPGSPGIRLQDLPNMYPRNQARTHVATTSGKHRSCMEGGNRLLFVVEAKEGIQDSTS